MGIVEQVRDICERRAEDESVGIGLACLQHEGEKAIAD